MIDTLFLIGRIFFGGFFFMNGLSHFTKRHMLVPYAKSKGVPSPNILVPLSGLFIILGGISFIFGIYPYIGTAIIVSFLFFVSLFMHNFWAVPKDQKMTEKINFMKNTALLGAALMFLEIPLPWSFSLGI